MYKLLAIFTLSLLLLAGLSGCGGGGGGSSPAPVQTPAEIAAAKLAKASLLKGTWLFSYTLIGGTVPQNDTLQFSTVTPVNNLPYDFSTNDYTVVINSSAYTVSTGHYNSTNDLWTVSKTTFLWGSPLTQVAIYEFKNDGSQLLAGACYYIETSGVRSTCLSMSGVKTAP